MTPKMTQVSFWISQTVKDDFQNNEDNGYFLRKNKGFC